MSDELNEELAAELALLREIGEAVEIRYEARNEGQEWYVGLADAHGAALPLHGHFASPGEGARWLAAELVTRASGFRTKSGRVLTDADIERLADEAERGYDVSALRLRQRVMDWAGWPDDVRDRLLEWNRLFLLSFVRTGDFDCQGCGRPIAGHPTGNAVVRHEKHTRGWLRCEDCLVAMARTYELPPPLAEQQLGEDPALRSFRRQLRKRDRKIEGLQELLAQGERKRGKLREQLKVDQAYIDELERRVEPGMLAAIRDRLRGQSRRRR